MAEIVPGSYDTEALSRVYVDGLELDALVNALDENQRLIGAQKAISDQQFWSSPRRAGADKTREVYEVSLNAARQVNFLTFDLARFPQQWRLFCRSSASGPWLPLNGKNGKPLGGGIVDSIPSTITPANTGSSSHSQHYGAGHWVRREFDLNPVLIRQFRLVMHRQDSANPPVDLSGRRVNYSLGVRGFEVGYKVKSRADIPSTPRSPVVATERQSFASTTDILGSPVSLSVRENRAEGLLKGSMWRCEPQPISNAVVSLYVDARDGDGAAQVVDRFYLEPTTSGVSMNIYYSNDTPDQVRFSATDNPLDFPSVQIRGTAVKTTSGVWFPASPGYVDIDNAGTQFNPHRPFWIGMTLHPMFAADDTIPHPILDSRYLTVEWVDNSLRVTHKGAHLTYQRPAYSDDEATPGVISPLFQPGDEVPFVVGFDGTDVVLYVDGKVTRVPAVEQVTPPQPKNASEMTSYLRVGGYSTADGGDPGQGNFRLTSMVIKAEEPASVETALEYFSDPEVFLNGGQKAPLVDTSDNALLRYVPAYATPGSLSVNPLGFIGGPSNRYEDLVWTPINRDFRLAKGYVVFNPTKAKYFKFEFTNLAAQPYDEYMPATRQCKVFATSQVYSRSVKVSSSKNTARGAIPTFKSAASVLQFSDQARLYSVRRPGQPSSSYIPTAGVYSTDPEVGQRLRKKSLYMNLQAWHVKTFTPRFVNIQKHVYETVNIQHTQRVAYFVGLSRIEMSRVDYVVDDDTDQYLEPFSDAANMVVDESGHPVGGWDLDEGWLAGPDELNTSQEVVATSKVFASRRKVTAIQFATQQTPPVQILPDPDMDDTTLAHWRPFGDTRVTPSEEFTTDIGTMVLVERNSAANYWSVIEGRYSTWDAIEDLSLTWDDLEASSQITPQGGLSAANTYEASPDGRLYAAARVYATQDLSAPLYVQVVDEQERVLSEEPITVKAGQVAEWYTSYTIGEGGSTVALDWDEVEAVGTWDQVEVLGTWDQVAQASLEYTGRVKARIVQTEPTADSWYVDNLSLFDDAIVWEFSRDGGKTFYPVYDIRNDPRGVFVFPPSDDDQAGLGLVWRVKATRGKQRVDYLALRPWYDSLPSGQPHRETIQVAGPNQAMIDHYPPITEDPRWKVWSKPIPEEWWFVFRQWLLEQRPEPASAQAISVPNSIVPISQDLPGPVFLTDTPIINPEG